MTTNKLIFNISILLIALIFGYPFMRDIWNHEFTKVRYEELTLEQRDLVKAQDEIKSLEEKLDMCSTTYQEKIDSTLNAIRSKESAEIEYYKRGVDIYEKRIDSLNNLLIKAASGLERSNQTIERLRQRIIELYKKAHPQDTVLKNQ